MGIVEVRVGGGPSDQHCIRVDSTVLEVFVSRCSVRCELEVNIDWWCSLRCSVAVKTLIYLMLEDQVLIL